MPQLYATESISASSSLAIGSYSTAGTPVFTPGGVGLNTNFSNGRRIIIWSSVADISGQVITLTGMNDQGDVITESIAGSTTAASPRATVQDFLSVTSVSFSSLALGGIVNIGTNNVAGTRWFNTDLVRSPFNLTCAITLSSTTASAFANFECTLDDITRTYPNPAPTTLTTNPAIVVPFYPKPFIPQVAGSTYISTAIDRATIGYVTAACAAWRVTATSSSSAVVFGITAVQAGV